MVRPLQHQHNTAVAESSPVTPLSRDDIVVKALTVQGGEADIGGEKTAFARIVMSGIGVQQAEVDDQAPRRQEIAVLKIDDAAALRTGSMMSWTASSDPRRRRPIPAIGNWSWTSVPPLDEDLLVARVSAEGAAVPAPSGMSSTVRLDFTGTLMQGSQRPTRPSTCRGPSFPVPARLRHLSPA